jgi:uncharacterized tellurite resistance protein B-like protein
MNTHDPFESRRAGFEEAYFRAKDSELVGKLRSVFEAKRTKDELRAATGIASDEVLDRLLAASVRGEMLTAFKLYPLVEIAWADGAFDHKEGEAVINAAIKHGVPTDGPALERLKDWLQRGPTQDARAAWYMYAAELRKTLSKDQLKTFREDLLRIARQVAEASGGILGTYFTVSSGEKAVMKKIEDALTHTA